MKLNPDYLPNQVLLAPDIRNGRPGAIEVILVKYLDAPEEETLDNGEKIMLDCIVHYPALRQNAKACSAMLRPAPPAI